LGSNYLLNARKVAFQTKQYRLMSKMYAEHAKKCSEKQSYILAFQHYAEGIFAAAHESDSDVKSILEKVLALLNELSNVELAQSFARKILLYLRHYSENSIATTKFWLIVMSIETLHMLDNKGNALQYLQLIYAQLNTD